MVELQLPKLIARVRFPSSALKASAIGDPYPRHPLPHPRHSSLYTVGMGAEDEHQVPSSSADLPYQAIALGVLLLVGTAAVAWSVSLM